MSEEYITSIFRMEVEAKLEICVEQVATDYTALYPKS
jgi:hypothetical protein